MCVPLTGKELSNTKMVRVLGNNLTPVASRLIIGNVTHYEAVDGG